MQIQINTDSTIPGGVELEQSVRERIDADLGRFADRLTRVEVHMGDVNGSKTRGEDKRCVIEARPAGRKPVSASAVAATFAQALDAASKKMVRVLDDTYERIKTFERKPA